MPSHPCTDGSDKEPSQRPYDSCPAGCHWEAEEERESGGNWNSGAEASGASWTDGEGEGPWQRQ